MLENIEPGQIVEFIGRTSTALEQAHTKLAAYAVVDQQRADVLALIPDAVQAMLDNKRIDPEQKTAAIAALQDPVRALQILIKVAAHRNAEEKAQTIGRPVDSQFGKTGSVTPLGAPRGDTVRGSDALIFERFLGLNIA